MNTGIYLNVGALMFGLTVPVLAAPADETLSQGERTRNVIVQRMQESGMIPKERAEAVSAMEVLVQGNNYDAVILPLPGAKDDAQAFNIAVDLMHRVEFQLSKNNYKPTPHEIAAAYVLNIASAVIDADLHVYEKQSGKKVPTEVTGAVKYSMLMSISNLMLGKNDTLHTFMPEERDYTKSHIAAIENGLAGEYVTYVPEKGIYIPKYEGTSFVAATPLNVELPELMLRMEQAAAPKDYLKVLRLLNKEMPDTRALGLTAQTPSAIIPFEELPADKAKVTSNWLSGGTAVLAPTPESGRLFNEVYYPRYQQFFRKCAKEERVFQIELPVCIDNEGAAYVDLASALNEHYVPLTNKHGVKFGVILIKAPDLFDAAALKAGAVFKAEVSLYAMAPNYAGALKSTSGAFGDNRSKMLQPVFANLVSKKAGLVRSAYVGVELSGAYNCGGGAMPVGNCIVGIDLRNYRCYLNKCARFAAVPLSENVQPEEYHVDFSLTENCYKSLLADMVSKLESAEVVGPACVAAVRDLRIEIGKNNYDTSLYSFPYVSEGEAIKAEIKADAWETLYSSAQYDAEQNGEDVIEAADAALLKKLAAMISYLDRCLYEKENKLFLSHGSTLRAIFEEAMYVSYINIVNGTSVKLEDVLPQYEVKYFNEEVADIYLEYDRTHRVYKPVYIAE